ncbi:MAG: choice-of-anchor D domain-containing protein, partial [Roseivirga sp.]|nr:choice-of-anchor D domain-containing protein [Roseivirga sp.]
MKKFFFFIMWFLMIHSAVGQIRITDNGVLVYPEILTAGTHNIDYSFGNVAIGSTKDVDFTITNTAANFQLGIHTSSMQATGPYSIVSLPATNIASAGGNSTFTIRFTPTATSGDSGTLYLSMAFTNQILTLWTFGSANTAPAISGTAVNQAVNDNNTLSPFSTVSVTDADGDNVSATITLDAAAKGVLSGTGLSDDGGGVYSIASTTVSDLESKLQVLTFNPSDNRSSTSETTTFTLIVNDGTDTSSDNTTTVVSSAVAPLVNSITLSGSPAANATSIDFTVTF